MAGLLEFVSADFSDEGVLELGFKPDGVPISFEGDRFIGVTPDGFDEHEKIIVRGKNRFTIRALSKDGKVTTCVASREAIPDDWRHVKAE